MTVDDHPVPSAPDVASEENAADAVAPTAEPAHPTRAARFARRRAERAQAAEADGEPEDVTRENPVVAEPTTSEPADATETQEPSREWADEARPPTALTWLEASSLGPASAVSDDDGVDDVFADARLVPGWLRPRVIVPLGVLTLLCGGYVGSTLLWPLHEVAPVVTAAPVELAAAPAATVTWPATGSAAVAVSGIDTVSSSSTPTEIASITKVASTMMVLDELPLELGEQGPSYTFDWSDSAEYWSYRWSNQSALDVPVDGSLSEYQMLQGVMLGSANNYIDRLSDELWGSDAGFAEASVAWLDEQGIDGVTLATPSGFDSRNVATPAGLIELGEVAMRNPVFAEIAATRTAELPGAGEVTNSNGMLEDAGVVGIKTGTLSGWNLLTAKDIEVNGTSVRLFAAVLGQEGDEERLAATRSLFEEVESELVSQGITVPAGTVVGSVSTAWGAKTDLVTDADAQVILWNGASATSDSVLELGDDTAAGATAGSLTVAGPLNQAETAVSLDTELPGPSIWWRLTHPLELFGLDG